MSLKVRPWVYRMMWIAVATLGAICVAGVIPLLIPSSGVTVNSGGPVLLATGVLGAVMLPYALWRLLWPLKAPPPS